MQLTEEGNRVSDESTGSSTDNDSGHETDSSGSPKSEGEQRPNTSILDRMLSREYRQRQSTPSCHCHPYKRREDPICSHPPKRLKEVQ